VWRESSAAPRQRGEREAPEDTKRVRLRRAQELLELLAAVGVDRRPLRAVVPDAAALDRLGDRRVGVDRLRRSAARSVVGISTSSKEALVSGLIELILLTLVSMMCGPGSRL
jgi:hypothetical protein